MKNLKLGYLIIWLVSVLTSCERYLDIAPPINKLETSSVFSDSASASSAIVGIYADMAFGNNGFIASQVRWGGLYSDELAYSATSEPILQFSNSSLHVDNSNNNMLWRSLYSYIYQANNVIEKIETSDGINSSTKPILIGEARFIRAFLFFYAVNNWGDVPLTLSTDYRINESLSRTPTENVYQQIIEDLEFSIETLPSNYLNDERTRPNKWSATALLARTYLFLKNWDEASKLAGQIVESGAYPSLSTLEEAFLKESKETIWQIFPATLAIFNTHDGYYFIPASLTNASIPTYLVTEELYGSFEIGDQRREKWIGTKQAGSYHFSYKYKVRQAQAKTEYNVIFRLAEVFLIRAEALAHLNQSSAAIHDLNTIRRRAGLNDLPLDTPNEQVLNYVEEERRHELFCEWGHRWYDLKRTDRVNDYLNHKPGNNQTSVNLNWPIPLQQIMTNPNLSQNDGY